MFSRFNGKAQIALDDGFGEEREKMQSEEL